MVPGVTCVVPARLGSTRFFGKLLAPLNGEPVIAHALKRAAEAGCFEEIICVTDSPEIAEVAAARGFGFLLTGEAANGTERIARALPALEGGLFVNLQGDEPAFPPEGLRTLCRAVRENPEWTHLLVHSEPPTVEEMSNANRVKVLLSREGFVVKFTRFVMEGPAEAHRLQLGAYAYSRAFLENYMSSPPSAEELELSHEMLRAPDLAPLRAHFCDPGASVDVPGDLEPAMRALQRLTRPERQARLQGTAP